ncbi:hypothetical protein PMAYCL1PPCAC_08059, partial [Pristionchus mayeri]
TTITCHAGIWLTSRDANTIGGQISNATCAPAKVGELDNDYCVIETYPGETTLNGQDGVCPRDDRNLVIRAVNESFAQVSFDNDNRNVLSFDTNRDMYHLEFPITGFKVWLVAVSCVETNNVACGCPIDLDMVDPSKKTIEGGVRPQVGGQGLCADNSHEFHYWSPKFVPPNDAVNTFGAESQATFSLNCRAGMWILDKLDKSNSWQVTNGTCAPPATAKIRTNMTEEMGADPCVKELFPADTFIDRQGVCTRDDRNLVIRGVNESGARLTFDNDADYQFLKFDTTRNMWFLQFSSTGVQTFLVAVSCATMNDTADPSCACDPLPMLDSKWPIADGVAAQVGVMGACADSTHEMRFWNANYAEGHQSEPYYANPEDASFYMFKCYAGIWIYSQAGSMGAKVSNVSCSPMPTQAA